MSKKLHLPVLSILFCFLLAGQTLAQQVKVVPGQLIRITPKLADLHPDPSARNYNDVVRDVYGLVSMRGVERQMNNYYSPNGRPQNGDPALQSSIPRGRDNGNANGPDNATATEGVDILTQFDGQGFTNVSPADPTLCVGQNHIIQMINGASGSKFRIYDKTGNPVSAQTDLDQLPGSGFFGSGDPIALYDQIADRYVLAEFGNITGTGNPTHLIICISQTNNPTGAWFVYRFLAPGAFPDYPKFGVWGNCYTATTNDFNTAGTAFLGCTMWVFDRTKMLAGDGSATAQINLLSPPNFPFIGSNRSLIPISHVGATAPAANAPAVFSFYNDDATTAITTDVDSISFVTILPNFAVPANTVIGRLPSLVPAAFKGVVCGTRNCAPGCGGSSGYDVLDSRNMFPANWRRFPTYDAITICHTVDAGAGTPKAGIRWYEFRNSGAGWTIYQQSTFSPDANFRYMPSMAMNAAGQIAMGYNLSGAGACSSIFFTGRNLGDPLNTLTFQENGARCGTGYGTFGNRWGDYNHMNVDPAPGQDSIFWFTAMYGQTNWNTRILKMKLSPNVQYDALAEALSINVPGAVVTGNPCAAPSGPASYTLCTPSTTPYVIVRNRGTQTITAINIIYRDGAIQTTYPQTGLNIPNGGAQQFALTPPYNATPGVHNVKVWTALPNGQPDQNGANDTAFATFTYNNPPPLPTSNNFVSTTFPGAGYSIDNPNANNTWVRFATGNVNVGSAFIDCFNFNLTGQTDDIRTQSLSFGPTDTVVVEFDLAHKNFPGFNDRLQVLASNDCGNTFVATTFDRSGAALATAGSFTGNYVPVAADWKRQRVAIGGAAFLAPGNIAIAWRCTNGFGNNIYIDNINVSLKVDRDIAVTNINVPTDVQCSPIFTPQVVVQNFGAQVATSYRVGYTIGTNPPQYTPTITTPLAVGASTTISLPVANTGGSGNFNFRAFTADLVTTGGTGDQVAGNDSLLKPIFVRPVFNAPIAEGFEGAAFPSADWQIVNPNNNNTWVRAAVGNNSARSLFIDNFNNNFPGNTDDYLAPPINVAGADSVIFSFDLAHRNFVGLDDRLQVLASPTCGTSFLATSFDRSGAALATAGSLGSNYGTPAPSDWVRQRVAIGGAALASGSLIINLRCTNGFGNNIFIDNINIIVRYRRDIELTAIARPINECNTNFPPSVRVTNKGIDTAKSFSVSYSIDNILPVTVTNFTGLNLAPNASQVFTLNAGTAAVGSHSIRAYTSNLVTNGGTGDQFAGNDSLLKPFNIYGTENAPLVEGFENATFAPVKWGITNADGLTTWARTNTGRNSNSSAYMNNFSYNNANGTQDELTTPMVAFTGVDSVFLSFDLSARTRRYPGSTQVPIDTLELLLTKDCGTTYTSVWKKWGEDLQTINDPNTSTNLPFTPGRLDWKTIKLNISAIAGINSNNLQAVFRSSSNGDNNVFIDNVNLSTLTLPATLKRNGYLIYPSPFSGNITVQHYLPPTGLRAIQVFNARGQMVASRQFGTGGAQSNESMDLKFLAAGVYTFKLIYTNKEIVERVVKAN
jgi:hypothetical protein